MMPLMAAKKKAKATDRHSTPQINLRLTPNLLARLEAFAEKHKRFRTVVIQDAIGEYLDRHGGKPSLEDLPAK